MQPHVDTEKVPKTEREPKTERVSKMLIETAKICNCSHNVTRQYI